MFTTFFVVRESRSAEPPHQPRIDTYAGAGLEDRSVPKPEEVLVRSSIKEELDSVLAELSSREARILRDRFGLAGGNRTTLREADRKYGVSKERIRQIEKKALRKISACDRVRQFEVYAN